MLYTAISHNIKTRDNTDTCSSAVRLLVVGVQHSVFNQTSRRLVSERLRNSNSGLNNTSPNAAPTESPASHINKDLSPLSSRLKSS